MNVNGENRDSVRRRNLAVLLDHVHRSGQISRASLTTLTGLNRSTVGALVADLAERGLVTEGEAVGYGTPGRPSPLVLPSSDGVVVLAAEVEVATLTLAVAGLGGHIYSHARVDRRRDRRTPEATADDLAALVLKAMSDLRERQIVGLGVAVAGIVRQSDGFVHVAPNLQWRNVPLAAMLADRIGTDLPVLMANDADLGALAEHVRGAGVGVDNMIYVASEVGVGGGIVIDGRLLTGAAGYAGEIGHITVNPDGAQCRCGARGCLEAEAGEWALLRHMGRHSDNEREAVDTILREAAVGSADALKALRTVGCWLGTGLADLVNIFNTERIVLGGMFARAFPHIVDEVCAQLDLHTQAPSGAMVSVVPAQLGGDSSLLGAVELALRPLLADPTLVPAVPTVIRLDDEVPVLT
jgi:predicted NBD/HSP70 family sugar kinase